MLPGLLIQSALIMVVGAATWTLFGTQAAWAFGYGGLTALANTGLLVWRWRRGRQAFHCDVRRHLRNFHRSSLERFFVVGSFLFLGIAWLKLSPLAVLTGFTAGLLAWVIAVATQKR